MWINSPFYSSDSICELASMVNVDMWSVTVKVFLMLGCRIYDSLVAFTSSLVGPRTGWTCTIHVLPPEALASFWNESYAEGIGIQW